MPLVWNKRDRGIPARAVYVGRPTLWGNPFSHISDRQTLAKSVVGSRQEAVRRYALHLLESPVLLGRLEELRGHDLVCWCAPALCHAEVLLAAANAEDSEAAILQWLAEHEMAAT